MQTKHNFMLKNTKKNCNLEQDNLGPHNWIFFGRKSNFDFGLFWV